MITRSITGHKTAAMQEHYTDKDAEQHRNAIEAAMAMLDGRWSNVCLRHTCMTKQPGRAIVGRWTPGWLSAGAMVPRRDGASRGRRVMGSHRVLVWARAAWDTGSARLPRNEGPRNSRRHSDGPLTLEASGR